MVYHNNVTFSLFSSPMCRPNLVLRDMNDVLSYASKSWSHSLSSKLASQSAMNVKSDVQYYIIIKIRVMSEYGEDID